MYAYRQSWVWAWHSPCCTVALDYPNLSYRHMCNEVPETLAEVSRCTYLAHEGRVTIDMCSCTKLYEASLLKVSSHLSTSYLKLQSMIYFISSVNQHS